MHGGPYCPGCRASFAAIVAPEDNEPEPGDICVCFDCVTVLRFTEVLDFAVLTFGELLVLQAEDPETYNALIEALDLAAALRLRPNVANQGPNVVN